MTLDGFRSYIRGEMKKGVPFLAYWYAGGMGMMRTGKLERPALIGWALHVPKRKTPILYDSEEACKAAHRREGKTAWMEERVIPQKPIQAKPGTIKAFRREMDRLEREYPEFVRVEMDGATTVTTGGFEL